MQLLGIIISLSGLIIGVIGITLFLLIRREVMSISKQVAYISEKQTNKEIVTSVPNEFVKELARNINNLVVQKKVSRQEHIRMEHELREAIANISHDLRTPLTSILGYIQLIEGKLDRTKNNKPKDSCKTVQDAKAIETCIAVESEEQKNQKVQEYLQIIKSRAETLNDLVESFYELSKISSKDTELELEAVHLERITCELIAEFYQNFVDKNLKLENHIPEKVSSIIGEKKSVERVVMNLLQNTLRYAKENVVISIEEVKDEVILKVTNEAGEVKEEDIPYLFDRFYMANRVRSGEGTGIGLAVVKKLVELMKGQVKAELCEGQLSFTVYLHKY